MTRMRLAATASVVVCGALLVAGCASSSSPSSPAAPSGSPSGSAPSGPANGSAPASSPAPSAPGSGTAASPRSGAGPACPTSSLKVTLGPSSGAAGSTYLPIEFTNTGTANCTLFGYPGVSLAGGSPPAQIGAAASRNPVAAMALVRLAPGAVASATLQVTVAGNYPEATCHPTKASTLVIYPPNQKASVSVPFSTTGCSATGITILHVSVVRAGAGG